MRGVNVGDEAEVQRSRSIDNPPVQHHNQQDYPMKKLSALIAVLFASASLTVLAQGTAAPSAKSESAATKSDTSATATDKKDEKKKSHKKTAKKSSKSAKSSETAAKTSDNKGQENKPSDTKAPK
jgi:uncharacterized protein YlxW (UPF0749 family)